MTICRIIPNSARDLLPGRWRVILLKALRPWRAVIGVIEGRLRLFPNLLMFVRVGGGSCRIKASIAVAFRRGSFRSSKARISEYREVSKRALSGLRAIADRAEAA